MALDCPQPHKRRHPSKYQAERAMWHEWRTGRRRHMPIRVYYCQCGFWHTTSHLDRRKAAS